MDRSISSSISLVFFLICLLVNTAYCKFRVKESTQNYLLELYYEEMADGVGPGTPPGTGTGTGTGNVTPGATGPAAGAGTGPGGQDIPVPPGTGLYPDLSDPAVGAAVGAAARTGRMYYPPSFSLPFFVRTVLVGAAAQAGMVQRQEVVVVNKKRQDFPIWIPATASSKASEPFRRWFQKYDLYIQGEIQYGVPRSELARELSLKSVGKAQEMLLKIRNDILLTEGDPGDPDAIPPRAAVKGGLDIAFEQLSERYADDDEDQANEDIAAFETWNRAPGQTIRSYIQDPNQRYETANFTGQLAFSNAYKTKLFFKKGHITEFDQKQIMFKVDGDKSRFDEIQLLCKKLL